MFETIFSKIPHFCGASLKVKLLKCGLTAGALLPILKH
jgi:hypothetical protein